ncbi:MAG TPA: acetylxylan esterase [Bacilli bacterium]|jgi:cephalosporin-C deacetylase|nr:acetylxylan esterase [Acholeplasmataceae bacterium]OQB61825.1 MAG: Cephalosporin-C deacetylase [Tenericutes bacterium ADurb.Bin140]HON64039.1 acetylxylan esterase [Bacilli bacterium]HPD12648.1 acetylxylan esterase [Bacilli bacterium]HPK58863.1 acetylxylan esterase [Bacilli bacterium]
MDFFECQVLTQKPKDFDMVWKRWLEEVHSVKNKVEIVNEEKTSFGKKISFYFDSVANTRIFAILYLQEKMNKPIIAYYHGHNSFIEQDFNVWHCMNLVNAGYSVVAIDMRFQKGRVIDPNHYQFDTYPSVCYNITDLENCYTKRLFQDALKVIDIIKDPFCFKETADSGIVVAGPSQGGGLSLMAASMADTPIFGCVVDVPSDCALKDRILGRYGKYGVIMDLIEDRPDLKEVILDNQDYFDVINMTDRIKCPVLASVGTLDEICPPRFFYQAYQKITSEKELKIYENFGHGGFEELHLPLKIAFLDRLSNR